MDLSVTLAGHRASWRYRGTHDLHNWTASQPWLHGGGCVLLHLGVLGQLEPLLECVRRGVRAADEAGFAPEIVVLSLDCCLVDGLKAEVCGARDVPDRRLANDCSTHPRLVVVMTRESGAALVEEADQFVDRGRKLAPDFRAAFVIMSTALQREATALDFAVGSPDDHVLRLLDETEERLFRAYLHGRIAWESGGVLARAHALDAAIGVPGLGDDETVEDRLNRYALMSYNAAAAGARKAMAVCLAELARNNPRDARKMSASLRDAGMLWSPFGRDRLRVVPWVARAVLLQEPDHACGHLLRNHLTCAPLAREILGRCLELEARERAKLAWSLGGTAAPDEAAARLHAFGRGAPESESGLYPACSPARPTDAWAFAGFGMFIDAAKRVKATDYPRRELHALRQLRNALAHGHYASWASLRRLLDVERRLGAVL